MKELMIITAALTPATVIAEELKNALQDFMLFPEDKEKRTNVIFHCHMFLINTSSGGTMEGAKQLMDELSSQEDKLKLFETSAS